MSDSGSKIRFLDNGDGTITDLKLGLMWSKDTLSKSCINHTKASTICSKLDLGGHTDWRLPTVEELFLLADRTKHAPAIDTEAFPDTKNAWYWSSTESAEDWFYAWVVYFNYGGAIDRHRDGDDAYVRAVRSLAGT
jgi:hypothetical protein